MANGGIVMIFDAHTDIFMEVMERHNRGQRFILDRYYDQFQESGTTAGIFVVYLEPKNQTFDNFSEMFEVGRKDVLQSDHFEIIKTREDFLRKSDRVKVIIGAESMTAIQFEVAILEDFYNKGLRHGMLTWNEENDLATGVGATEAKTGLKPKGKEFILKMEELGMIIDLSHTNEHTFYDIMHLVKKPVICSHSNVKALCNHRRNLTDDQIKEIAARGGVIGVTAVANFISDNLKKRNVEGFCDHIDYIVKLVGIDHVGLGMDYMGFNGENAGNLSGLFNFRHTNKIIDELVERRYNKTEIAKILYGNFARVVEEILN